MVQGKTILVVGVVAEAHNPAALLPREAFADFEEQTVYEVVLRLKVGKPLPAHLMTTVHTQDELLELVKAVEGRGIRLALMTDERGQQPQSVEELQRRLAGNPPDSKTENLFPIL